MEKIVVKVDIPAEFKQEFNLALDKIVKQLVMNLKLSVINEISEIPENDFREVKESVVKEVIESIEQTSKKLKSGEIKPMTLTELDSLMGLK